MPRDQVSDDSLNNSNLNQFRDDSFENIVPQNLVMPPDEIIHIILTLSPLDEHLPRDNTTYTTSQSDPTQPNSMHPDSNLINLDQSKALLPTFNQDVISSGTIKEPTAIANEIIFFKKMMPYQIT